MNSPNAFLERSRKEVGRFLQTAVIVDDRPHFSLTTPSRQVVSPGRRARSLQSPPSELPLSSPDSSSHDLDARQLINAFAELGIVCAVLQPILGEQGALNESGDTIEALRNRIDEATRRADIVVLDWNIRPEGKPGQNAKLLIDEILKADKPLEARAWAEDHSRRLRLIAIYTGDNDLDSIVSELDHLLGPLKLGSTVKERYCVTAGPVRISVYGKGKPTIVEADADRRVDEKELPARLQRDFAGMTGGLLSNAALAALSAIRINTHRLLTRFNPGIDAAYVAHRAMMDPPEEAEEHPVPLISSEIEGVLADDAKIPALVGLEAISEWLDHAPGFEAVRVHLGMKPEKFRSGILFLLKNGLARAIKETTHPRWKKLMQKLESYDRQTASILTRVLAPAGTDETKIDMEYALLTSLRSQYESPAPVLKLGTIVAVEDNGRPRYFLCIQPVCDSVRLKEWRPFPFLRLRERTSESDHPFDFVVPDGGVLKRLAVSWKPYDIHLIDMKPEKSSRSVKADRVLEHWHFQRRDSGSPIRWLADLKPAFAHRVVTRFVAEVSRVGLTESEWLRRMAKNANLL